MHDHERVKSVVTVEKHLDRDVSDGAESQSEGKDNASTIIVRSMQFCAIPCL